MAVFPPDGREQRSGGARAAAAREKVLGEPETGRDINDL
jgi:hypothetical protein